LHARRIGRIERGKGKTRLLFWLRIAQFAFAFIRLHPR